MPTELEARLDQIIESNQGLTLVEIAAVAGCHLATVSKHLKARGYSPRPTGRRRLYVPNLDELRTLHKSGQLSLQELSDYLGDKGFTIGKEALRRRFKRMDLGGKK